MDFLILENFDDCKTDLRTAQREVQEIVWESARHQKEEMEDRLTRMVARNDKQCAIMLHNIRKAKEIKKIRFLRVDKYHKEVWIESKF